MKRNKRKYNVKKIYPRFRWTECHVCNDEYKKEVMYRLSNYYNNIIVCRHCVDEFGGIEGLINHLSENGIIVPNAKDVPPAKTNRIPPPPPPPYRNEYWRTRTFYSEPPEGSKPTIPKKQG